jgi:TonB family protein
MKKVINSIYLLSGLSVLLFAACTSNDYNKETTSTEVIVPDTSHMATADNTQTMMPDTSQMAPMDSSSKGAMAKQNATAKVKRGKVSSTMMTSSGKNMPMNQDKQGYYNNVEILPMFPGGQNALDNFINNNIEYPEDANENSVEGVVKVYFAVDEAGKVSNPKIIGKPLGHGLEDEVLKAVNKMPTWTPGVIKGKNVKTYYTLPVNFKLEN